MFYSFYFYIAISLLALLLTCPRLINELSLELLLLLLVCCYFRYLSDDWFDFLLFLVLFYKIELDCCCDWFIFLLLLLLSTLDDDNYLYSEIVSCNNSVVSMLLPPVNSDLLSLVIHLDMNLSKYSYIY